MPEQYHKPAKLRLQLNEVPLIDVAEAANKVLAQLPQVPEFGWHNCAPRDAGRRLKEHLNGVPKYTLLQNIAHAKRRIHENIIQYIDGKLPVWIRKFKYAADVLKVIRYAARIVGTARFLQSLLVLEVELANHYCNEGIALIDFADANLTPSGLRTQAEQELAEVWLRIRLDLQSQIQQNNSSLECLI